MKMEIMVNRIVIIKYIINFSLDSVTDDDINNDNSSKKSKPGRKTTVCLFILLKNYLFFDYADRSSN
jgi:hypothetical protein